MTRIEPLHPPYPPSVQQRLDRLLPQGMAAPQIFRTVARNEGLFNHLVDSGWLGPSGLLDRGVLPKRLREALILRTCVAARNDYEWRLHVQTISSRMGLDEAQIEDTRSPRPDPALWTEAERAGLALADALVPRLHVDEALFARLRGHFDEPTLIEMTQLIGLYVGVAMLVALARPAFDTYEKVKQAGRPDSVHGVSAA